MNEIKFICPHGWVRVDAQGRILESLAVGTIVDTPQGRCKLGVNGQTEFIAQEGPNLDHVISNLWDAENPNNVGFRNGKYYPFTTANGNHDVAFGIDLDQNPELRAEAEKGITKERAEEIGRQKLLPRVKMIDEALSRYTTRPDTISPQIKEGLLDMNWQLGDNGLFPHTANGKTKGYPSLFRAIAEGDYPAIQEESKVMFRNTSGEMQYDKRRHQMRLDNYFRYDQNSVSQEQKSDATNVFNGPLFDLLNGPFGQWHYEWPILPWNNGNQ